MTEIQKIKLLLGLTDTSKDDLLELLYEQEEAAFLDYTNRQERTPFEGERVIAEMVIHRYNRLGSEGLESTSYNNISEHYSNEYSESIKHGLNKWRKVKLL